MFAVYTGQSAHGVQDIRRSQPVDIVPCKTTVAADSYSVSAASSTAASRAGSPPLPPSPPGPPSLSASPDKRAQAVNAQTFMLDALFS